jgi:hypothetical protein
MVWSDIGFFDLKIYASIVANAFCELHNDKYTKYSLHKNCVTACLIRKFGETANFLDVLKNGAK